MNGRIGALCVLGILMSGCREGVEEILEGGGFSVYPPEGSMAMRGEMIVAASLGAGLEGLPEVTVLSEDRQSGASQRWEGDCSLSEDGSIAACFVMDDPPNGQDFEVQVYADGQTISHHVSSRVPELGTAFALHEDVVVSRAGRSEVLANLIRELIEGTPMVGTLGGWTGGAFEGEMLGGLAEEKDEDSMNIKAPGLTLVLPIRIDAAGQVNADAAELWMPLVINDELLQLRLKDCVVVGEASPEGLNISLEGAIDGASLVRVIEAWGWDAENVLSLIRPDVDTDGDRRNDALSLELSLKSPAVNLTSWETTSN